MTRVRTDAEGAGCRRTLKKATELERKARAYRTGNRLAVGGGCKTAGHFISGAGYRSQWPRYATGDLGPMRGKLFVSLQASC